MRRWGRKDKESKIAAVFVSQTVFFAYMAVVLSILACFLSDYPTIKIFLHNSVLIDGVVGYVEQQNQHIHREHLRFVVTAAQIMICECGFQNQKS